MTTEKPKTRLIKCVACKGKKDLVGLGFTVKKCGACAGIGFQEEIIDPIGYLEQKELEEKPTEEQPKAKKEKKSIVIRKNYNRKNKVA